MRIDAQLSRDFRASEFACTHCGAAGIHQEFVGRLQQLRDALGVAIRVTSGYRCALHPVEISKPRPGWHTHGLAADITGPRLLDIWRSLKHFPEFTGIGVAPLQNYMHLDTRPLAAGGRVVWAYNRKGQQIPWSGRWEELPTERTI